MTQGPRDSEGRRWTRREMVRLAGGTGAGLVVGGLLAACGASGASGPAANASPASAAVTPSVAPSSSASPSPAIAQAAATAPGTWDDLLAAGRAEGTVVVAGPPDAATRQQIPDAFKQFSGIDMQYLPDATAVTARLQSERAAGQYTLDAEVNGSDSVYLTLLANGWLDPFKNAILLPEAADGSKWKSGSPWFRDLTGDTVLQVFNTVQTNVTVNTQVVSAADISTADSLLDPKWNGQICAFDPGVNGSGLAVGCALYVSKGADYTSKLYKGQNVTLTRDFQQLVDWVAHGTYPIGLGASANYLAPFIASGLTFANPALPDAPPCTVGGFGLVAILNNAPHPNAARVFANWIASQAGLSLLSQTQFQTPVRNDVDPTWLPPQLIPQPGINYLDTYDYTFETAQRSAIRDYFSSLLK